MKTSEVIAIYKSQRAIAEALHGCTQAAVAQWGDSPPPLRQLELENLNPGRLVASAACDRYRVRTLRPRRQSPDLSETGKVA
jgi:hypothetical protein